ncbi:YidB family protein [Mesorhizobium sp. WSM4935]|uniref:YidB family protein n=1 Tax=Mesorhizobium sp. WSM4935 TaxID=3038547 RepID=UPI00241572F5|nr:YidB family protein [Mesorhizobium sp. WSM4935]MDG4876319.1 YidB family protein [Mesorhizobium sp. WSM4935]
MGRNQWQIWAGWQSPYSACSPTKIATRSGLRGSRDPNDPRGGILDQLSKGVSGTALGDIVDRFRDAGAGSKVGSWVSPGPNQPIGPNEVEAAIDDETLASRPRVNRPWRNSPGQGGPQRLPMITSRLLQSRI